MFCKTCGSLLVLEKNDYGKWMRCPNGHPQPELNQNAEVLTVKNIRPGKHIEIMDEKNILAVHDFKCPACGFEKAELIEISANYSDEDNIHRMKCGRCGHVEQLEGKVK
jgi:DNA-directed RNA polymerase subunit M/transcription elongation factor TFIIS